MSGGSDHEVVVVFSWHPPLRKVQGEFRVLLELLLELGLVHDLVPELGEEVHGGQHLLGLLLPDCLHGTRHKFFFLSQLQPGGPLAHSDEGHVVVHHSLVILVVEPRQGAEPVPHYLARVLFAELDSVCKDRLEEVLLLASGPLLLLLLVLLFLPLPHDVLDMFPLLVPLLKRHGPSLLLLELPLITGYELPKARVQAGTVGERLQTTGGVLVLDHRGRGS